MTILDIFIHLQDAVSLSVMTFNYSSSLPRTTKYSASVATAKQLAAGSLYVCGCVCVCANFFVASFVNMNCADRQTYLQLSQLP